MYHISILFIIIILRVLCASVVNLSVRAQEADSAICLRKAAFRMAGCIRSPCYAFPFVVHILNNCIRSLNVHFLPYASMWHYKMHTYPMQFPLFNMACSTHLCPFHPYPHLLPGGAEGDWDDGLAVALQGAGAAGDGSHLEHSLGLVDNLHHLLCLQRLPSQCLLQGSNNFRVLHVEGQGDRLLLSGGEKTKGLGF